MSKDLTALKADIEDWLIPAGGSENLQSQIPTFIQLAEELHKYGDPKAKPPVAGIRIRDMIQVTELPGAGTRFIALPADYLDMRRLKLVTGVSSTEKLHQVTPEALTIKHGGGLPTRYAISKWLEFNASVSTEQKVEIMYYAECLPLSDQYPTNCILERAYGCYLYGALVHAAPYLRDKEYGSEWAGAYANAAGRVQMAEHRGQFNQGQLRVSMPPGAP